jgi:hypothetical protein
MIYTLNLISKVWKKLWVLHVKSEPYDWWTFGHNLCLTLKMHKNDIMKMLTNITKSNQASRLKIKFSFNNKTSKQDFQGNWITTHSIHSPLKKNQCCGYLIQTSKFHENPSYISCFIVRNIYGMPWKMWKHSINDIKISSMPFSVELITKRRWCHKHQHWPTSLPTSSWMNSILKHPFFIHNGWNSSITNL